MIKSLKVKGSVLSLLFVKSCVKCSSVQRTQKMTALCGQALVEQTLQRLQFAKRTSECALLTTLMLHAKPFFLVSRPWLL